MSSAWDRFAAREPYFAILTNPRYRRAEFDAAAEAEFFETGEGHVAELYGIIRARVSPHFAPVTALEYGCGVGRLAIPLARRIAAITAVDISPAMLEAARTHIGKAGVVGIDLLTTAQFAEDRRRFDLVNCFLVLQRLRPAEGLMLLEDLLQRVSNGGVGVFHLPYRTSAPAQVTLARAARARIPGVNAVVNALRRKPLDEPLIEAHTYDLNDVFALLQQHGFESPHVVFTRQGDLDAVVVHARRRYRPDADEADTDAQRILPARQDLPIDVKELIATTPLEQWNRTAEEYFASLSDWEHHLSKPFNRVEDTPALLINFATLLQGLALNPGLTVLEYGAGSGWLSRFLTQLGCRTILLDVSPTALKIAEEHFARLPPIGDRPAPSFLVFDGRHIALPDASVDRIVCFDAFHHAPNPDEVLREFGRVLKPGGIAAFAEPGPHHSTTAQSQFEMRTYGVLENDIDLQRIWATAQTLGFSDLRVAAFNIPRFHVSLAGYDELLEGGNAYAVWAEMSRAFMANVRNFFLTKSGIAVLDSRHAAGLQCTIEAAVPPHAASGQPIAAQVTVRNSGTVLWLPSKETVGGVLLGMHLYDGSGRLVRFEYGSHALPRTLAPGEEVSLAMAMPALDAGRYIIELDCVASGVTWFAQTGSQPVRTTIDVT